MSELRKLTCTRFPVELQRTLQSVPSVRFDRLKDVFKKPFSKSDEDLLREKATPAKVQLNMTAIMIRRECNLLEARQGEPEVTDVFISAAMECMELTRARAVRRARHRRET